MAKNAKKKRTRRAEEEKIEKMHVEHLNLQDKLFVVFCIVLFFLAFYFLTLYITHKNSEPNKSDSDAVETNFSYDEILLGRSLSMDKDEYYVIFYDSSDEEVSSTCSELVSTYRANTGNTLYFVDMHDGFNSSHSTDGESNKNPSSASELSINGPTVIKISNKQVVDYVEGLNEVSEYLK